MREITTRAYNSIMQVLHFLKKPYFNTLRTEHRYIILSTVMENVYIPSETQENVFSYCMYSSAKGLAFKRQIQDSWFKVRFQKLQRALETKSRETYQGELV